MSRSERRWINLRRRTLRRPRACPTQLAQVSNTIKRVAHRLWHEGRFRQHGVRCDALVLCDDVVAVLPRLRVGNVLVVRGQHVLPDLIDPRCVGVVEGLFSGRHGARSIVLVILCRTAPTPTSWDSRSKARRSMGLRDLRVAPDASMARYDDSGVEALQDPAHCAAVRSLTSS